MRYMLDANTVSHLLRQHPIVTQHVVSTSMESLCISSITEGELLFGLAKRPENKKLQFAVMELLKRAESIAWDSTAAQSYGPTRATLHQQGKGISSLDILIASHAISIGATLVTDDQAMQQVPGIHIEDWTKSNTNVAH